LKISKINKFGGGSLSFFVDGVFGAVFGGDFFDHFTGLSGFGFPEFMFATEHDVFEVPGETDDELFDGISSEKLFKFFNVMNLISHFHHVLGSFFQKYSVREIRRNTNTAFFQYLVSQFHYSCPGEGLDLQQCVAY
jgi:hypothetical protein